MHKIKSQRELAEVLKVSRPTIKNWSDAGMPFEQVGAKTYEYDLDKVVRWLINRSPRHRRWVEILFNDM